MLYRIFDNGGETADRYTVVFNRQRAYRMYVGCALVSGEHTTLEMSPGPFATAEADYLGEEIHWSSLPLRHQQQLAYELDDYLSYGEWRELKDVFRSALVCGCFGEEEAEDLYAEDCSEQAREALEKLLHHCLRGDYRSVLAAHRYVLWDVVSDLALQLAGATPMSEHPYDPRDIEALSRAARAVSSQVTLYKGDDGKIHMEGVA